MSTLDLETRLVPIRTPDHDDEGPKGYPFLGILPLIKGDPLNYFVGLAERYGAAVPFRLGRDQVLLLSQPRDIRRVLQDNRENYEKSKYFKELDPILKGGLVLAEGDAWKKQRQCTAQGFKGAAMKAMVVDMNRAVSDWLARPEKSQPFDAVTGMMHLTLDIALRALLGTELRGDHQTI